MFTRTKDMPQGGRLIAHVAWDSGDPNAGIGPGFSEDTLVEIEADGWKAFLTWTDYDQDKGEHIKEPEDFLVESFEVAHGPVDVRSVADIIVSICVKIAVRPRVRLSELPDVLEVVMAALEDFRAAERLSVAQESAQMLEAELERLRFEADERLLDLRNQDVATIVIALEDARIELDHAKRIASERGV